MHYISALLYLILAIQTVHASDREEIKYVDLNNQEPDTVLTIKDQNKHECRLITHSYILKNSKYLRVNHELNSMDVLSVELFKKIIDFIYTDLLFINSPNEFMEILYIQERFEFDKLDEFLLRFITNNLESLHAQELVVILKFMLRSHIPLAKNSREIILKHIASNQMKINNSHRSELIKYIGKNTNILQSIDEAIANLEDPLAVISASLPEFEENIRSMAQKVNKKFQKGETLIYLSSSLEDCEQVMILLFRTNNIISTLLKPKGRKNKYRLKITSKAIQIIPKSPRSPWGNFA